MTGVYLRKAQKSISPVHFLCISHMCVRSFDPQYVTPSVIFTSLDLSAYKCAHTLVLSACINICTPFLSVSTSSLSCAHTFVNLCLRLRLRPLCRPSHVHRPHFRQVSLPHLCHLLNYYTITAVNSLDTMQLTWRLGHGTKGISWAQGLLCTCSHRYIRHYIYGAACCTSASPWPGLLSTGFLGD